MATTKSLLGKMLLVIGVGLLQSLAAAPSIRAADLEVAPAVKRVHVHHRRIFVRDYDGTPIYIGRYHPTWRVLHHYYGAPVLADRSYRTYPVDMPQPRYYFNGEPVRGSSYYAPATIYED